jgi:hypothetical protein
MAVNLQTPYKLDKVHLDYLYIDIEQTNEARTVIKARLRLYSQDPVTHVKVFGIESWDINIPHVAEFVTALAMQGDMRGVAANDHVAALVALLAETGTPLGSTTIA